MSSVNEDVAAPSEPVASLGDSPAARQVRHRTACMRLNCTQPSLFHGNVLSAQAGEEQLQTAGGAPRPQQAQQAASSGELLG